MSGARVPAGSTLRGALSVKHVAPKLDDAVYERNFADINPRLPETAAVAEASRCLFCYDAPCIKACPTEIDIPSFIKKIVTGNLRGSARNILEANVLGHACRIYEKRAVPGGLNTHGIAAYRTRASDALREVELVRSLGVEIRDGVEVGRQVSLEQLRGESDALFLGIGLGATERLRLPGEDLPGVIDALGFKIGRAHV